MVKWTARKRPRKNLELTGRTGGTQYNLGAFGLDPAEDCLVAAACWIIKLLHGSYPELAEIQNIREQIHDPTRLGFTKSRSYSRLALVLLSYQIHLQNHRMKDIEWLKETRPEVALCGVISSSLMAHAIVVHKASVVYDLDPRYDTLDSCTDRVCGVWVAQRHTNTRKKRKRKRKRQLESDGIKNIL